MLLVNSSIYNKSHKFLNFIYLIFNIINIKFNITNKYIIVDLFFQYLVINVVRNLLLENFQGIFLV